MANRFDCEVKHLFRTDLDLLLLIMKYSDKNLEDKKDMN